MKAKPSVIVYIAGPMTKPDILANTGRAIQLYNRLLDWSNARRLEGLGPDVIPICPQFSSFAHMIQPRPYEEWIEHDLPMVSRCDVVFRIPGDSAGADRETAYAIELGKPVFADFADLLVWIKTAGEKPEFCDVCPHALALHNPDGTCPCGVNCPQERQHRPRIRMRTT